MSQAPKLTCSQCGQPEAHAVGDEILCAACCHERGSCGATREASTVDDHLPSPPRVGVSA